MANTVKIIESILQQDAYEAEKILGEAISHVYLKLRDTNSFSGSVPVISTLIEYEKDIEYRRSIFLSRVEQAISNMDIEQRRELFSSLNDLAMRWLGPHIAHLQEKLNNLAARLQFHDSKVLDMDTDRVFKAIEAHLHILLNSSNDRKHPTLSIKIFWLKHGKWIIGIIIPTLLTMIGLYIAWLTLITPKP
jgi:hypothetical protein